jgi:outer membrane protein TolC
VRNVPPSSVEDFVPVFPDDFVPFAADVGFERKLLNGSTIAGGLALDVVSLLRDDWRSLGVTGDLTMTVPLMRGAGREIVREPLTQAERNLAYAIRRFELYRQSYAVAVTTAYYDVLEYSQRLKNALENERRLDKNSRRAEMMFEAGRMQRIQVDQARSDLLVAGESVISVRKSYETKLDAFKVKIGLPPEANLLLDSRDLANLEQQMSLLAKNKRNATEAFPDEAEACRIALSERHDLAIARCELEDAARAVKMAADALRMDLKLTGAGSADRERATGESSFSGGEAWHAGVRADPAWNRRKERNAFKKQLIALEQAKRTLEESEDGVKQAVRSGLRSLLAARASYENQVESVRVARLRVDSNNLFLQSGRSSMRDILEAEAALLSARNALCSALINWRMTDLALRRDMGVLRMSETGMWREGS